MSILQSPNLLRIALIADAVASGASAVLLIAGAGFLSPLLGLSEQLLLTAGVILVPFVALVAALASRARPSEGGVWAVILLNVGWVAGSVLLLAGDLVSPTAFGYVFVIAQAIAVALLADLQYFGLRNATAAAAH